MVHFRRRPNKSSLEETFVNTTALKAGLMVLTAHFNITHKAHSLQQSPKS